MAERAVVYDQLNRGDSKIVSLDAYRQRHQLQHDTVSSSPVELHQEGKGRSLAGKIKDKGINGALWLGEKSIYITAPAAIILAATGPLTAGGAAGLIAFDAGTSFVAGRWRRGREEKGLKQGTHMQLDSKQIAKHEQAGGKSGVIVNLKQDVSGFVRDVGNQVMPKKQISQPISGGV